MKRVLSLLVAFVFLQVQSWALSGGPQYGSINNNVIGTWAGTLTGTVGSGNLGLFQFGIPDAGLGSGTFTFFVGGGSFFGTMVALADGEKSTMSGVFEGSIRELITFILFVNGNPTTSVPALEDVALMGGSFTAKITGNSGGTTTIGVGARLTGTATAQVSAVDGFTPLPTGITAGSYPLTLDGFEQSSQVTGTVSLNALTSPTGQTGGGGGG